MFFCGKKMSYDEKFMLRALEIAELGKGCTNPNPMVGAVIVYQGKIVAEGYHQAYGQPHAEVNALRVAGKRSKGAELYVTLEPCSHYGKTPPCALAIIEAGIRKVYIGATDPNPLVAGAGIDLLQKAGIAVQSDLMTSKVQRQNEFFWHYITKKKPFVIFKSAASLDGKTATATGESQWITCPESRALVHRLRQSVAAVLVGAGTVLADDPSLTARQNGAIVGEPYRIVMDAFGSAPLSSKIFAQPTPSKTIMVCSQALDFAKKKAYEKLGATVLQVAEQQGKLSIWQTLELLGKMKIDSLLLEGGATLASSFLHSGAINKFCFFFAPKILAGHQPLSIFAGKGVESLSAAPDLSIDSVEKVGCDLLVTAYAKKECGCSQG